MKSQMIPASRASQVAHPNAARNRDLLLGPAKVFAASPTSNNAQYFVEHVELDPQATLKNSRRPPRLNRPL